MASKNSQTPQEQMREYKREIDRGVRELDREMRKMEREQARLQQQIKQQATKSPDQVAPLKVMAQSYMRTKRSIQKFYQLRTYLQGVGIQLQTMKSVDAMTGAMKNASRAMVQMSRRINMPQLQSIMRTFAVESEKMEMTQDVVGDTLDTVLGGDEEEEEADDMVKQVLAEINFKMVDGMAQVNSKPVGTQAVAAAPAKVADAVGGGGGGAPPPDGGAGGGSAPPPPPSGGGGGGGGMGDLQARLEALKGKK